MDTLTPPWSATRTGDGAVKVVFLAWYRASSLVLFILGQLFFPNPRTTIFNIGSYQLAWVEILLVAAAIMAMAEQIKVATPGVNNTTEVLLMGAIAIIQVVLFALAAAKVPSLAIFDNTEFLLLTIINLAQTAVAYQINSATLMRTISST